MDDKYLTQFKYVYTECNYLKNNDSLERKLHILCWCGALIIILRKRGNLKLNNDFYNSTIYKISFILEHQKVSNEFREFLICLRKVFNELASFNYTSRTSYLHLMVATANLIGLNIKAKQSSSYKLYPRIIHIETQSICNAKCSFCDYDTLARKGYKMSDDLIEKIIKDLSSIPDSIKFTIQPYKISEPFLEKRLPVLVKKFLLSHKGSFVSMISNGNYLPEESLDQILSYVHEEFAWYNSNSARSNCRFMLTFSLNECSSEKYEKLMKMSFYKTLDNLKHLQDRIRGDENLSRIPIEISRVSTSAEGDRDFLTFCKKEFPLFKPRILKMNNWISTNEYSNMHQQLSEIPVKSFKGLSCSRWTDLSIMSTGEIALCCMDSGTNKLNIGNVKSENCLDLYQAKCKEYIPSNNQRGSSTYPCNSCTYQQGNDLEVSFNALTDFCSAKNNKWKTASLNKG